MPTVFEICHLMVRDSGRPHGRAFRSFSRFLPTILPEVYTWYLQLTIA
jgi:hypothetical protein